MNDEERESEEIDVDIYEGDPDFESSSTLDGGKQDEDGDQEVPDVNDGDVITDVPQPIDVSAEDVPSDEEDTDA